MIKYKKKKILLQSGGTRNFYYKVTSNGKKKQISKIEYLNKKGGNPFDSKNKNFEVPIKNMNELFPNRNNWNKESKYPYVLITCGPTGSGKSSLIDKSLRYLKLEKPLDKNIFIIDNLVEENSNYKEKSKNILEKYFSNTKPDGIKQKITNLLHIPTNNKNNSIFKKFTNAYFSIRDKIFLSFDEKINLAIENNENFILETTGRSFPTIIGLTDDKYKVFISYSLVEFCTLIDRNIKRMIDQIELFLKKNSIAPRLPDIRFQKFGEAVTIILKKLIAIIDKCNSGICKTNSNFAASTDRKFNLIIFDNTISNDVPIFDSDDKSKNLDEIKKMIMNTYQKKNKC
jgi:hypothetical protein